MFFLLYLWGVGALLRVILQADGNLMMMGPHRIHSYFFDLLCIFSVCEDPIPSCAVCSESKSSFFFQFPKVLIGYMINGPKNVLGANSHKKNGFSAISFWLNYE